MELSVPASGQFIESLNADRLSVVSATEDHLSYEGVFLLYCSLQRYVLIGADKLFSSKRRLFLQYGPAVALVD